MTSRAESQPAQTPQIWVRPGLLLYYFQNWASPTTFEAIKDSTDWQQGSVRLFGQTFAEPRLTAWAGDVAYTYSQRTLEPRSWSTELTRLRTQLMQTLAPFRLVTNQGFNHCLLNYYRDGADAMGWHRDNEVALGSQPIICSISLGSPRRFRLRPYRGARDHALSFDLGFGDLLVMAGQTQEKWEHALMKTTRAVGPRINLTFRSVIQ